MKKQICYFCKEEIEGFANTIGDYEKEKSQRRDSTVCCDSCYKKVLQDKLQNSQFLNNAKDK